MHLYVWGFFLSVFWQSGACVGQRVDGPMVVLTFVELLPSCGSRHPAYRILSTLLPPPILRREKFQIQVQPCFYFTCGPGTHSTIFTAPALHYFDPAHRFLPRSPLLLNYFLTLYILFSLVVQSTLGPRQHRNSNHRPHPKSVTLGGER
jgi:hypothetical protein